MGIRARCPNPACGREFNLKDELAGKTVRCSACKQTFRVPDVAEPTPPSAKAPGALQETEVGRPAAFADPLVGTRIAHYRLEALIGQGGMGKVYKARNLNLDKSCALKILPPEFTQQDATLIERFIREARSAASVEHPNVLPVHFVGKVGQHYFIEMQYVDGGSLEDLLKLRGRLEPSEAARINCSVANALHAAHRKGIIHRDVKPSNVMLTSDSHVFVADFGLAKIAEASTALTARGYIVGTPLYMSPEQANAQPLDFRSDIYSLGVMFYQMLTGNPPYTADSPLALLRKHESAPIPDVMQLAPDTPPKMAAMIRKMMAKSPDERYQNCAEIAQELIQFSPLPSAAISAPPLPRRDSALEKTVPMHRGRRKALLTATGIIFALLVIGLGAQYLGGQVRRRPSPPGTAAEKSLTAPEIPQAPQVPATAKAPAPVTSGPPETLTPEDEKRHFASVVDQAPLEKEPYFYLLRKVGSMTDAQIEAAVDPAVTYEKFADAPASIRGKVVNLQGRLLRLKETQIGDFIRSAFKSVWEGQIADNDSRIISFVLTQPPPANGFNIGQDNVILRGIFLKNIVYRDREGGFTACPLIIARRLVKLVAPPAGVAAMPRTWTSEPKRVKVATPEGDVEKDITYYTNTIGMKLVLIPAGEFMMGDTLSPEEVNSRWPGGQIKWYKSAQPRHRVRITKEFYMGACEVTRGQFAQFVRETSYQTDGEREGKSYAFKDGKWGEKQGANWRNPLFQQSDDHPAVCVSWNDATAFRKWLSEKEGRSYRLPTEAEWEYAARAGSQTTRYWGEDEGGAQCRANIAGEGEELNWTYKFKGVRDGYTYTAPGGRFSPNAFGLYDMIGNAWEWCSDWFDENYYGASPDSDPTGPADGTYRVLRGGSWYLDPWGSRSAYRCWVPPKDRNANLGLRVVCELEGPKTSAVPVAPPEAKDTKEENPPRAPSKSAVTLLRDWIWGPKRTTPRGGEQMEAGANPYHETRLADMPVALYDTLCSEVIAGKIYLFGGCRALDDHVDSIFVYDIAKNSWREARGRMPYAFDGSGNCSAVWRGKVYMNPGIGPTRNNGWGSHDRIIEFDPATESAVEKASFGAVVWGVSPLTMGDYIYWLGACGIGQEEKIWRYDPNKDEVACVCRLAGGGRALSAIKGPDGRAYCFGGQGRRQVDIYDPNTNTCVLAPVSLPQPLGDPLVWPGPGSLIYLTTIGRDPHLWSFDTATSKITDLGPLYSFAEGCEWPAISYDPATSNVYFFGGRANGDRVRPLNIARALIPK